MNRKAFYAVGGVILLVAAITVTMPAQTQAPEKWLHVRVDESGDKAEIVRVNLPLSFAEKVLPALHVHRLHEGRVKLNTMTLHDVDLRAVLEAVKNSADGEYVTVQSTKENVRVAKKGGYLLIEVRETKEGVEHEKVDIKLPMALVDAMLSGPKDELDLVAAIRVLQSLGDTELVTAKDRKSTVRIWVDSKNTAE